MNLNDYMKWGYSSRVLPNTLAIDVTTAPVRNLVTDDYVVIDYFTNTKESKDMLNKKHYEIDRVIINEPATIIIWKDKTKTVVKCGENDDFNPEAGIALAYMKHCMFDDKTTQFNKWMNKQTSDYYDSLCNSCFDRLMNKAAKL